jgi:hypothetical protein
MNTNRGAITAVWRCLSGEQASLTVARAERSERVLELDVDIWFDVNWDAL